MSCLLQQVLAVGICCACCCLQHLGQAGQLLRPPATASQPASAGAQGACCATPLQSCHLCSRGLTHMLCSVGGGPASSLRPGQQTNCCCCIRAMEGTALTPSLPLEDLEVCMHSIRRWLHPPGLAIAGVGSQRLPCVWPRWVGRVPHCRREAGEVLLQLTHASHAVVS